VLCIDADGQAARRQAATCTRDVFVVDEPDGLSLLMARMATPMAHAIRAQVEALARHRDFGADDGAMVGERRADALAALVLADRAPAASGDLPVPAVRAHLDVVIDLRTLLGMADNPAELAGAGSCPCAVGADVIRDLLRDPDVAVTMRRLVTDPMTGHLLDVGRRTYEVPAALRRLVVGRDRTCRFPGCRRRADRCQIDHATAWDEGGGTSIANLGVLCTRHHQLKTHARWQIDHSKPDGSCTWTSPQGRTYSREPEPLLPPNPPHWEPDPGAQPPF